MRQPPWFLVRHTFLELRRLMPAGQPWQAGAGLLGLFASTFFRPFLKVVNKETTTTTTTTDFNDGFSLKQEQGTTCSSSGGLCEQGTETGYTCGPGQPARPPEAKILRRQPQFFLRCRSGTASWVLRGCVLRLVLTIRFDRKNPPPPGGFPI